MDEKALDTIKSESIVTSATYRKQIFGLLKEIIVNNSLQVYNFIFCNKCGCSSLDRQLNSHVGQVVACGVTRVRVLEGSEFLEKLTDFFCLLIFRKEFFTNPRILFEIRPNESGYRLRYISSRVRYMSYRGISA